MLKIEHLTKHYKGSKKGITDLSLHIAPGDLYAFIGHNGAGKTTTLKCVTGIQDFDAGSIQICGIDLTKDPVLCKQQFAYIPDNPDIYEYLTGIQYLNFTADVFKIGAAKRAERIRTYGDLFEITASLGDLISSYSHGMKQKLAIMGALIHEPRLLILDEPFVGLDPEASLILKNKMHALCERGSAIFFSTHVLEVAEKLCSRIAVIAEGHLAAEGTVAELTGDKSLEDVFMEVAGHGKTD